ncbi:MAG: sulfotransferase [Candidatus Velamenicoccus archaeovorus]
MTLPTFLGIGAPRAGTTWLHTLAASHPDVYMPGARKEIRFFDVHYERGVGWYEGFFCSEDEATRYRAIGEISPQYLLCERCPERIAETLPDCKLIVMLRHPVARAYSQYGFFVQRRHYTGSFEDFVLERPLALEKGFYSRYLKRYLERFDRSRFLVLVSEDVFADVAEARSAVAAFLGIRVDRFPGTAGRGKVNASSVPDHPALAGIGSVAARRLRRWHLEPVVDLALRSPLKTFVSKGRSLPPLDAELKRQLGRRFEDEFGELERSLQIDLSSWRS